MAAAGSYPPATRAKGARTVTPSGARSTTRAPSCAVARAPGGSAGRIERPQLARRRAPASASRRRSRPGPGRPWCGRRRTSIGAAVPVARRSSTPRSSRSPGNSMRRPAAVSSRRTSEASLCDQWAPGLGRDATTRRPHSPASRVVPAGGGVSTWRRTGTARRTASIPPAWSASRCDTVVSASSRTPSAASAGTTTRRPTSGSPMRPASSSAARPSGRRRTAAWPCPTSSSTTRGWSGGRTRAGRKRRARRRKGSAAARARCRAARTAAT